MQFMDVCALEQVRPGAAPAVRAGGKDTAPSLAVATFPVKVTQGRAPAGVPA